MAPRRTCLALATLLGALVAYSESAASAEDPPASSIQKDAWRRPRWVWLDAEAGFETVHLRTFHADFDNLTAEFAPTTGNGAVVGTALGFRVFFFTLGARGRVGMFHDDSPLRTVGDWQLWTVDGEIGFRAPLRRWEPYLTLAAGYAAIGGFNDAVAGLKQGLDVSGANVRGGLGVDVFLTPNVSLRVNVTAAGLFLARSGVSVRDLAEAKQVGTLNETKARVLEADGSSGGWSLTVTAGPGFHF